MDIQQILINAFTPFVKTYWWMIQLLLVLSFLKTSFMKGLLGELFVNIPASTILTGGPYRWASKKFQSQLMLFSGLNKG
jgi:restriction system protein